MAERDFSVDPKYLSRFAHALHCEKPNCPGLVLTQSKDNERLTCPNLDCRLRIDITQDTSVKVIIEERHDTPQK
ncbi:MAG: hypothetical protein UV51_C0001G0016 [Candidatus Woesebacteria bacterium GW2011_GWC1_42_9]|nr:MAG: hypothetical protein UV51_C0001G0016 [Candidatus Woesebacteria bacterium GW2011_GWC1_42_9]